MSLVARDRTRAPERGLPASSAPPAGLGRLCRAEFRSGTGRGGPSSPGAIYWSLGALALLLSVLQSPKKISIFAGVGIKIGNRTKFWPRRGLSPGHEGFVPSLGLDPCPPLVTLRGPTGLRGRNPLSDVLLLVAISAHFPEQSPRPLGIDPGFGLGGIEPAHKARNPWFWRESGSKRGDPEPHRTVFAPARKGDLGKTLEPRPQSLL